jgi:phenylalanyl-tRNA synthetase alpha chain
MPQRLKEQLDAFQAEVQGATDEEALYELQVRYIGKKGVITQLRKQMGKLDPDARKAFGMAFNETKQAVEEALDQRRQQLAADRRQADLARTEDLTMGVREPPVGSVHPITQTRRELQRIFHRMGFDVAEGPHVETELYNFDMLNIPGGHPARDMQDTFFVDGKDGEDLVLRTHTSPVQIRSMLLHPPPVRVVALGTVFRRDDDATHSPMFNQIEGLCVDKGVTMADLKATLYRFVEMFFGRKLEVRFRPSYFPFVEPGAEFDVEWPFGDESDQEWLELGGSGMVHPSVLSGVGIDPEVYTGWAFGFGIDRMAMLRHGVHDLRLFFDGDVRFLEQF